MNAPGPSFGKLKILRKFRNPQGHIPWAIFYKIFIVCGQFHGRSSTKIWANLLKGFPTYGSFNLVESKRTLTKL